MTSPRPSPIGEGVKKGKTQIIPVGSITKHNAKVYNLPPPLMTFVMFSYE